MIPEYDKIMCVRIPERLKVEIDKLVASGKVKSASDFVRKAIEQLLKET